MFDNYLYAKVDNDYIVLEEKVVDEGCEMNLYLNDQFIYTETGLKGEFHLKGKGLSLLIKKTYFKTTHNLSFNNEKVTLQKIKLKELQKLLTAANIFTDFNLTIEEIEKTKLRFKHFTAPLLLILLALVIHYFTQDLSKSLQLLSFIPSGFAGILIYLKLQKQLAWFDNTQYGCLGPIVLIIFAVRLFGELLFSLF